MASDIDEDILSEEETLSVVKRRTSNKVKVIEKKSKHCEDIDVEVDETVKSAGALDYRKSKLGPSASTSKPKKQSRKYCCRQCETVFATSEELRSHVMVHQIETRHKCEDCGRCFHKASSLKIHQKVHEQRELKCPICDLVFTQKSDLGVHIMSHEPPEQCPSCPDKFHTKKQLRSHSRIHNSPGGIRHEGRKKLKEEPSENASKDNTDMDTKTTENNGINENYNEFENYLKREELDHATQCAIVSKIHKGRPVSDICRLYNVTPEVVNEIWEDRDKYMLPKNHGKLTFKNLNNTLDTKILEWYNEQKTGLKQVTGKMVRDIAEEIAKDLGFIHFNGSSKWLDRFKARYKITLRAQQVNRDSPSAAFDSKWKKAFFKDQWCDARIGFTDEDIYTSDEVGIYYNPSKGRIKKYGGKKFIHGYVKDRLSILMCTNVTGTHKKKLLVCGFEDPLIHSYREPDTLPVNYIRHSQAHFTTKMFEEYVEYWNEELKQSNKKALLILDRATIHTKMQLSHLKLCFVPWKASVGLIPIRNGIYAKFRDEFRKLILEEKAINVLKGVDRNLTCMEALYMLEKAWERTPPGVIVNSFKTTGYDVGMYKHDPIATPKVKVNDEEEICQMLKDFDVEPYFTDLSHLDMYLTVDEDLVTGQGTKCSVFGGNHKVSEPSVIKETEEILPISTERPESDERENEIKRNRAMMDLEIVRNYLRSTNTSYEMYCNFMDVENFLYKTPM